MILLQNMKHWQSDAATCLAVVIAVALLTVKPVITFADDVASDESTHRSKIAFGAGRSPCCCQDDFVRKPVPSVCAAPSYCLETYNRKPCLSLPSPTKCCCTDVYCPKPIPLERQPNSNSWYKCVVSPPFIWKKPATGRRN